MALCCQTDLSGITMNATFPEESQPPAEPAELERVLRDSRTMEEPPDTVLRRAFDIWPARTAAAGPSVSNWKRLWATLSFDSGDTGPLALGLRGNARQTRQWLFECEAHDIDLRLSNDTLSTDTPWQLSGQVLGPQAARRVRLVGLDSAACSFEVNASELGDFHLDRLPAGRWQLSIDFDDWSIDIPQLTWPTPPAD